MTGSGGPFPQRLVVIGTGLIGTSVALAMRALGAEVWLADRDPATAQFAAGMGAGTELPPGGPPGGPADLAVLAMPPEAVADALAGAQRRGLARYYTDVASVKELPLTAARELGCDLTTFAPGHPIAGREHSGPAAARADLFLGRPWAVCPDPVTAAGAVDTVTALAVACGAQPARMAATDHDRWVALVSHVPHLVSAAMAARLELARDDALALAGQGLRDVTRIAGSDTGLWTQILSANAEHAAELLPAIAEDLLAAAAALSGIAKGDDSAQQRLTGLLDRAGAGVARIPGKRGVAPTAWALVQVVIGDQPGELARLFHAAGETGINIEDVRIEHSQGRPSGVVELSVSQESAAALTAALAACGWPVRR